MPPKKKRLAGWFRPKQGGRLIRCATPPPEPIDTPYRKDEFPFLKLPPELRDQIYEIASQDTVIFFQQEDKKFSATARQSMIRSSMVLQLFFKRGLPSWATLNKIVLFEALEHIHRNWVFFGLTLCGPLRFLGSSHYLSLNIAWNFDGQRGTLYLPFVASIDERLSHDVLSRNVRLKPLVEGESSRIFEILSRPSSLKSLVMTFGIRQYGARAARPQDKITVDLNFLDVFCKDLMHVRFVLLDWDSVAYLDSELTVVTYDGRVVLKELKQRARSAIGGLNVKVTMHCLEKRDRLDLQPLLHDSTYLNGFRTNRWIIEASSGLYRRTQAWKDRFQLPDNKLVYSDQAGQS